MKEIERAVSCFKGGFNCCQSVLSAYAPQFGLSGETAMKIAAPLGGGMGCLGEVCGAVTGAFMVIGLKFGYTKAENKAEKEEVYRLVREFADQFQARNGSIICRELLGYDISTPEGRESAKSKDIFATRCPKFVQDAAEIVASILEQRR